MNNSDELLIFTRLTPLEVFSYKSESFQYIKSKSDFDKIYNDLLIEKELGIDIEQSYYNSYFGYICLIQISTSKTTYLLDIILLREQIISELRFIFESKEIIKVFYSGQSDLLWLQRDFKIKVNNYFDIKIAAQFINNTNDSSLVGLIDRICNVQIDRKKKKEMQLSDWWKRPLTNEQLNYAAMDSHFLIFIRYFLLKKILEKKLNVENLMEFMKKITEKKFEIKSYSEQEAYENFKKTNNKVENNFLSHFRFIKFSVIRDIYARNLNKDPQNIISDNEMLYMIENIENVDKNAEFFKENSEKLTEILSISSSEALISLSKIRDNISKSSNDIRIKKKSERRAHIENLFTRKTPAYENCSILAPDGNLLCHCDSKKIKWYLERGLASPYFGKIKEPNLEDYAEIRNNKETKTNKINEIISENNKTILTNDIKSIILKFEPKGRGFSELEFIDNKFYTVDRANQCVICGNSEKYLKFHIVPLVYRQSFPNSFKSHRSHDVVLLCFRCHESANKESEKLRQEIADEYGVPLFEGNEKITIRNKISQFSKFGCSLVKSQDTIPKDRRKILKTELRVLFNELKNLEFIEKTEIVKNSFVNLNYNKENQPKINQNFFNFCISLKKAKNNVKEISNQEFKNQHGKLVVEKLKNNQEIKDFILRWRKNFINRLNPQFLPQAWNVYHQFERSFGKLSKFNENKEEEKEEI